MKVKVKGIEAAVAGLARAGIKRAELAVDEWSPRLVDSMTKLNNYRWMNESVPDAQNAIGTGFSYARKGVKTVSFIGENKLFYIAEVMNGMHKLNAAYVIVVMEQHEKCRFTEILYTYGIHFWSVSDPGGIYEVMYDAAVYSEAYGKPVVIWYPQRFLICDAMIDYKNLRYRDNLSLAGMKERAKQQQMIRNRYNRELRSGKNAIVVSGELAGLVCRMTEEAEDTAVISADMYYPELSLPDKYEKILLAEKGEVSKGTNLYMQADMKIVLPSEFFRWEEILFHSLSDYLKEKKLPDYFEGRKWQRNYDEMLKIRKPDTEDQI